MLSDEQLQTMVYTYTGITIHSSNIEARIGLDQIQQQLHPRSLNPYQPQRCLPPEIEDRGPR